jgi:hydrogenase expression/formation protein HypD
VHGVIFTCFGDMLRVPGRDGTLLDAKAEGADVRMVYSPLDALRIAAREPGPRGRVLRDRLRDDGAVDRADAQAREGRGDRELLVHVQPRDDRAAAARAARVARPAPRRLHRPGHVSTVVGARPFEFIPADYGKPVVVSGFEPVDSLQSVLMIMRQLAEGRCEVENQYGRVVPYEGNLRALQVMGEVFALRPHFEWRGLGFISQSALRLSDAYRDLDAEVRFSVPGVRVADPKACQCGEVLKGVIKPWECKVFGTACTPEHAIGTCMVSPEGACAAYYNYGRFARDRAVV